MEAATGTTGDDITDVNGNVVAVETASLNTSTSNLSNEEVLQIESNEDVDIIESIDLFASSYQQDILSAGVYGSSITEVTQLSAPITVTLQIPVDEQDNSETYSILRVHEGVNTILTDLDSEPTTVTFQTDQFSTYAIITAGAPEQVMGDANGDGFVNALDIIAIRNHILERTIISGTSLIIADVNDDGYVNALDILHLRDYLLERISSF